VLGCTLNVAVLAYNQRHSVDMTTSTLQGSQGAVGGANGVVAASNFSVINGGGDSCSQQDSGSTTPLAFDFETRSDTSILGSVINLFIVLYIHLYSPVIVENNNKKRNNNNKKDKLLK